MSKAIRVVIADDHALYRHGLAEVLRRDGVEVLAEVPNGDAAVAAALRTDPNVVVMDLNMPGVSGIEATRRLLAAAPGIRVLVLTVSAQGEDVADALRAGAVGYVLKDAPVEEIVAAVRAAAADRPIVSPRTRALTEPTPSTAPARRRGHRARRPRWWGPAA
jgi:DNA-binding NarL/FixJ family response regulator